MNGRYASAGTDVLEVVVAERATLADGIVSLTLCAADGGPLPRFTAGAHVDVHVAPGIVRPYSLCNSPAERGRYRLAVLREANSRGGSAGILRDVRVGGRLRISHPRNNFALVGGDCQAILIAGGIGVTPLLAMAYRLDASGTEFAMHYCARTRRNAAFVDELATASFAHRVAIHYDDAPETRLSIERIQPTLNVETHVYVCGPPGFIDYVLARLTSQGWADGAIHIERFAAEVAVSGESFTVLAAQSGRRLVVGADRTIAQTLLAHGIEAPLSCDQGICGSCLARVLKGVPEHRDLYQTDEEKAANTHVALCCSRAKTPELVLDI